VFRPGESPGHDAEHQQLTSRLASLPISVSSLPPAASFTGVQVLYNNGVYYSNGTSWLSQQIYPLVVPFRPDNTLVTGSLTATRANVLHTPHPDGTSDIYATIFTTMVQNIAAQSGTNFWTVTLRFRNAASATAVTAAGDTKLYTVAGTEKNMVIPLNQAIKKTDFVDLLVDYTLSGAGGQLNLAPGVLWFRLVGV